MQTQTERATYDDLLSYYNQPHHLILDRFSIQDALNKMAACSIEVRTSQSGLSYDQQFERLMKDKDPNSSTEETFLEFLHKEGLRLPDEAQKNAPGIYVKPDFFYAPDTWVFCDGTPHDETHVQEKDEAQAQGAQGPGRRSHRLSTTRTISPNSSPTIPTSSRKSANSHASHPFTPTRHAR